MKSEIMARARGGNRGALGFRSKDCGPRGMLGSVARSFSSRNSHARATLPIPIALRARKWRRGQRRGGAPPPGGNKFIRVGPKKNPKRGKKEKKNFNSRGSKYRGG